MAQVKVFGIAEKLNPIKAKLSETIGACIVEALKFPPDKRAHRFSPMAPEDMLYPEGRTDAYTIIEITMMEGRTVPTKKRLVRLLFDRIRDEVGISHQDLEICIYESPPCNWGFRGMHGDEVQLNYKVDI
ncbi:MAG: tautomerase family protein [Candidatus Latescibacteria bacterium]|nr:tautomerase family protein [Candidatus Latescibacterota bacterium]